MLKSVRHFLVAACLVPVAALAEPASVSAGQMLYQKNCLICHGDGPSFIGTIMLGNRLGKENAVLLKRQNLPGEYVEQIVRRGMGTMPGFRRSEISDKELQVLIGYMQQQGGQP